MLTTAIVDDNVCQVFVDTVATAGPSTSFCTADTSLTQFTQEFEALSELSVEAVAAACGAPGLMTFSNQSGITTVCTSSEPAVSGPRRSAVPRADVGCHGHRYISSDFWKESHVPGIVGIWASILDLLYGGHDAA